MIQFFRKIRQHHLTENKFSKYLIYAIGEIVLVVIGILIALQINNLNNERIKRIAEYKYYENIKGQITEDKEEIIGNKNSNNNHLNQFNFAVQIIEENDRSRIDTLETIALNLTNYSDVNRQGNIYETMVNSGEINLLNNSKIKEGLRKLEETYIYINKMEDIHRDVVLNRTVTFLMDNFKIFTREATRADDLFSIKLQNLILFFIVIMDEKNEIYNRALDNIEAITELIDDELELQKDL